jgi:hypothetical protein
LAVSGDAERHRADVFLVLAHEEVLNLGATPEDDDEQAGGERVERAAVADLLGVERAADYGNHVVRGHAGGFIDQEDAVGAVVLRAAVDRIRIFQGAGAVGGAGSAF